MLALQEAEIPFVYEPERFFFGRFSYLPDVVIGDTDFYIEITGWDKPAKQRKRLLFMLNYDVRLCVVDLPPTQTTKGALVSICKEVML